MAKVILKIGYQTLLLPNDTGLAAILKALSGAVSVDDYRGIDGTIRLRKDHERFEIAASLVAPGARLVGEDSASPKRKVLALLEPTAILL